MCYQYYYFGGITRSVPHLVDYYRNEVVGGEKDRESEVTPEKKKKQNRVFIM